MLALRLLNDCGRLRIQFGSVHRRPALRKKLFRPALRLQHLLHRRAQPRIARTGLVQKLRPQHRVRHVQPRQNKRLFQL